MRGFLASLRKKLGQQKTRDDEAHHVRTMRMLYVIATVALVCIALLLVVSGNHHDSAIRQCSRVVLIPQRDACFSSLAIADVNASMCGHISYMPARYSCMASIAEQTLNATLCTTINDTSLSSACVMSISNSTRSAQYCSLLGSPDNSTCIYNIASTDGFANSSICGRIYDPALSSSCTYQSYFADAMSGLNASKCALLPNENNMTLLSSLASSSNLLGATSMEFQLLNATPRTYCYYNLAQQTNDGGLCNFTSGNLYSLCNSSIASAAAASSPNATNLTSANLTSCSLMPSYIKPLCELGIASAIAISTKNASICLQISSEQYQNSCITSLASKYLDASYCALIANSTAQQACEFSATYGGNSTT